MFDVFKVMRKLKMVIRNRRRATIERKRELKEHAGKLQRYFPINFH